MHIFHSKLLKDNQNKSTIFFIVYPFVNLNNYNTHIPSAKTQCLYISIISIAALCSLPIDTIMCVL